MWLFLPPRISAAIGWDQGIGRQPGVRVVAEEGVGRSGLFEPVGMDPWMPNRTRHYLLVMSVVVGFFRKDN